MGAVADAAPISALLAGCKRDASGWAHVNGSSGGVSPAGRSPSGKGGDERSAQEDGLEGVEQCATLLVPAGQIAADARERVGAARGTERAGDRLLHLEHAQIPLGLVPPKILPSLVWSFGQAAEVGVSVTA